MTTDTRVCLAATLDFRPDFETAPPTVDELGRAWQALRAGQFRDPSTGRASAGPLAYVPSSPTELSAAATTAVPGPAALVVGAHGWSGASTTALLLAEAAARAGRPVRLVDAADPTTSGLVGAAVTEHGHDPSGQWRRGTRPIRTDTGQTSQVRLQRLDQPAGSPVAIPAAAARADTGDLTGAAGSDAALTVVDAGWPLPELLRLALDEQGRRHWLARLLTSCPLVVTARATVPAVQRAGVAAAQLSALRTASQAPPVLLALIGAHRLPRLLGEVLNATLPTFSAQGRVVLLPARRDFAVQGITSSDLPRQLVPAGTQLLQLAAPHPGQLDRPHGARRRRGDR